MTDQPDPGEETALLEATIEALSEELAALRAVACGYCPHCGRGDAAPTVQHWEHQRQRADTAERERDTARQHAAAIAAQRDRLRQRMTTLADRWDHGLAVDAPYARTLRDQISVAPFHGEHTAVQPYRADDRSQRWAARCWGTDRCDGWLSLDHDTQRWAEIARDRHLAETHGESNPAATEATGHVYLSTGCHHGNEPFANGLTGHEYCQNKTGILGAKKPARCKSETCQAPCICHCHTTPAAGAEEPARTTPDNPASSKEAP